jgi:hypothetical protein
LGCGSGFQCEPLWDQRRQGLRAEGSSFRNDRGCHRDTGSELKPLLQKIDKDRGPDSVIAPGVHADFDREGRLIGIAVLDASERLGQTLSLEVSLALLPA